MRWKNVVKQDYDGLVSYIGRFLLVLQVQVEPAISYVNQLT